MNWHKVRCFDCGAVYDAQTVAAIENVSPMNYCPCCGCDYLLGFSSDESEVTIQ